MFDMFFSISKEPINGFDTFFSTFENICYSVLTPHQPSTLGNVFSSRDKRFVLTAFKISINGIFMYNKHIFVYTNVSKLNKYHMQT